MALLLRAEAFFKGDGRQCSEKAVGFLVGTSGKEQCGGGTGRIVIAAPQRPQAIDQQCSAVGIQDAAEELAGDWIEGRSVLAAEVADEGSVAESAEGGVVDFRLCAV